MRQQDLGMVTAYAYAVSQGYTGTEEEFAELMASYATVAERAEAAATAAETAQGKAEDAQTAAEGAQTAAETAQGKAEDAQGYAEAAETAAETAQGKAEGAQTAAEGAQTAAETAQGKAETAQGKAEDAQTAAETAQGYAEGYATAASGSASTASTQALKSEGYAVGTQDGTPVASGSPYYENNSKYYADEAAAVAASIPADYSELSEDVADLKSALSFATDVESVGITVKNKYLSIVNNHIDVDNPKTSGTGYGYTIVPCVAGDVFTVSGVSSGTEPMAWAFTDSTYTILSKALASRTITDERITAPQNTAYLVIHDKSPYRMSYKGIRDAAAEKLNAFTSIPFVFADQRIDASGNLVGAQNYHTSDFYPCKEGEKIEFYGMSFYYQGSVAMRIISFYDEHYSVISHIDQIDGKSTTVTEIGYITAVAPTGAKYVRISTANRPEFYAYLYDIWDIVNNHAGLIRAGYSCAGDMLKKSVFAEEITDAEHRLLYRQGFCVYDGKYYSVEEGHIGVQDSSFATVGTYDVSIGHGNSIQVGSSNIAYINGATDHKVYCVNLDTGEVTDTINLPFNSGAECAVIDDINNIAYILHTDLISASTPAPFVLVAYDIEGAQVISTKPLPFKILQFQAVDFYEGKIILFAGTVGSNDDRLYVIDLSGSAIGKAELNLFVTNDEPEGVFYDRDKGDLYVSGYSGKIFKLVS